MCGTGAWGVAGALGSFYFAYLAYTHLRDGEYGWAHDWESVLAGAVWILLIVGLISEVRCWRENVFFGLLLTNFTLAFCLAVWKAAPENAMRMGREISLVLWILAGLASLLTLNNPGASGAPS